MNGSSDKNENRFFNEALKDMTFEYACGAAIRHLVELGLSPEEIKKRLDYPVSVEKIKGYIDKNLISGDGLENKPNDGYEMILEYDEYGRRSYRKIKKD